MAKIQVNDHQFYFGESAEEPLALIQFEIQGNILSLLHTEVSSSLKGQGIGQQLVEYAVEYARKNQLKIVPVCPFVIRQFEKNPEYNDVKVL